MSKSAILDELPKLAHADRREILERICEIEEADLLRGAVIDSDEKAMLDSEWTDPNTGSSAKMAVS
jgi:hypothetical protein